MSTIAVCLLVLIAAVICFATEVMPVSVTALLASIVYAVIGIIPYSDAFAGFANETVILIFGVSIVGYAVSETKGALLIGQKIISVLGFSERKVLFVFMLFAGLLSCFVSNSCVMAIMMPLIASVSEASGGKIKKVHLSLPIAIAVVAGGGATLVGSTPQLITQSYLQESGIRAFTMFELAYTGLPFLAFCVLYFSTFGYKRLIKATDHLIGGSEEKSTENAQEKIKFTPKMVYAFIILFGMIIGLLLDLWTHAIVAVLAACCCIAAGCVKAKEAYKHVDWNGALLIVGSLGIGKALAASGTTSFLAKSILGILGENPAPILIISIIGLLCTILGNLMSHTAQLAILLPLFLPIAESLHIDGTIMAFAVTGFVSCSTMSPLGAASYAMPMQDGFGIKDYVRIGLLPNIFGYCAVVIVTMIRLLIV